MCECQGLHWGNTLPGPSYSDQETGAGRDQEDAALVVGAGNGREVVRSGWELVRSGQEVVVGNAQVRVCISLQGVEPACAGIV